MSFSIDVKYELCGCEVPDRLREALRYGMMFGFKGSEPHFVTYDKKCAGFVRRIFPKHMMNITVSPISSGNSYCVMPADPLAAIKYDYFEKTIGTESIGASDEDVGMFLRGAFITCGNVYVQQAGYHFELSVGDEGKTKSLYKLINEQGMNVNISHRGAVWFLFSKNSENIADILTFMGAVQSAMKIMNIKIIKEVRSNINRSVNCETANIDRTARASAKQLDDIRLVLDNLGGDKLSDELREIAELRLNNPDMSLRELGTLTEPNLSRSGINHRFEKISKLAEEIRNSRN
ncbi:MAG: DNA-binding protein WhiA [Ruminiclostridium sp.]|nr:DNA-binding protein WhiA [Ruminiclostridium sp.]